MEQPAGVPWGKTYGTPASRNANVITGVLADVGADADPRTALRRLPLGLFDAIVPTPVSGQNSPVTRGGPRCLWNVT